MPDDKNIPDQAILYRYVKPSVLPDGQSELPTSIFNDTELSCDWSAIQNQPENSLHVKSGKNLLVSIAVCDSIRNPTNPRRTGVVVPAWAQQIVHDPLEEKEGDPFTPNPAHSLIKGSKKGAVTDAIRNCSTYQLLPLPSSD